MSLIDLILFVVFAVNVLYVSIFAFASLIRQKKDDCELESHKRIAILIPAYREDSVVEECVQSCLNQVYPKDCYTVAVISDQMQEETNERLSLLPISLILAHFENSTKSKALNLAMSKLQDHDLALILDADNTIGSDFLQEINHAFVSKKTKIVQTHRTAKNINSNMAYLDAVSEEINNSIFRQGHTNLGLSASFIGSGMVFDYTLFKEKMSQIDAIGGFDRHLMLALLKTGLRVDYLPDAYVYDEKVQSLKTFSNQRKRWLSAQFYYVGIYLKDFPKALLSGNVDFCDMYLQQLALPRVILLGFAFLYTLLVTILLPQFALKWWILFVVLCLSLTVAIPRRFFNRRLIYALIDLPKVFVSMFLNFFKLGGANKKFIHTPHGTN